MSHHHALPLLPGLFLCPHEAGGVSQHRGSPEAVGAAEASAQGTPRPGRTHQHLHFTEEEAESTGGRAQGKSSGPQRRPFLLSSLLWAAKHQCR